MPLLFENFTRTTLSADITNVQTTITVDDVSNFPALGANQHGRLVIRSLATPSLKEVIHYTAISGNDLTVARGQEGTTPLAFVGGDEVLGWITRDFLNDLVIRNRFIYDTSVTDHSNSSLIGSLAREVADAGGSPATIEVAEGVYTFLQDFVVGANIKLVLHHGAQLSIASPMTLTINGPVQGCLVEHFPGTGTIAGSFNDTKLRPEWFGAVRDGATDDRAAIERAVASAPGGGIIIFSRPGIYQIGSNLDFTGIQVPKVSLEFEKHAQLRFDAAIDVTFDGNEIIAKRTKILEMSATSVISGTIDVEKYFPEWFGGVPDDTTDSHDAIEYCVDLADNDGGGVVELSVGKWRMSGKIDFGEATILQGASYAVRSAAIQSGASIRALDAVENYMFGNKVLVTSNKGIQILNLSILGNHAGGNAQRGIQMGNVKYCKFKNLFLENFDFQAIHFNNLSSTVSEVEGVLIINSVLAAGLGAPTGAMHIQSFDNIIKDNEIVPSAVALLEGGNRVALVVDGANNFFENLQCSFGEDGVLVTALGDRCQFSNVRSDLNFRHGFNIDTGGGNQFSNCQALNNSQDTDNTYDGFRLAFNAINNVFSACKAISNMANTHRYGFSDENSSFGNIFDDTCQSTGHTTAEFNDSGNRQGGFQHILGFAQAGVDDATPDIQRKRLITIPQNTAQTQITSFDGETFSPQILTLRAAASTFKSFVLHDGVAFRLKQTWYPRINDTLTLISNTPGQFQEIGRNDRGVGEFMFEFDVTQEGFGAIATHRLFRLDDNAHIINALIYIETAFSITSILSIGVETDDPTGILAPVLPSGLALGWTRTGLPNIETPATYTAKTTAPGRAIIFDVSVAPLVTGRLWLYGQYLITS